MRKLSAAFAATILGFALMLPNGNLRAAELQVLAGLGIAGPLRELGPRFESATGHKLVFAFDSTPNLIKRATSGSPFDLGIVPREVFKDEAAQAKFKPAPMTQIAQVGLGVAVRAGAPRPDIATPDALKQTLLKAQSITTQPVTAAGAQVLATFERLGIAEAVKPKLKAAATGEEMVAAIAKGDVELGVFLTHILTAPGLDLVGSFPAALQQPLVYLGAVATESKNEDAAKAFIDFLKTPAAIAVIKAKGMEPL